MKKSKVYIIGDTQLGRNYSWKIDKYKISERTKDMLKHFENICDDIISYDNCALILIVGDFLDSLSINHTIEQYIHKVIFVKLKKAKIGIIIIAGNHDVYSDLNRGCMLDNFDHNLEVNSIVLRDISAFNFMLENSMKRIGKTKQSKINAWWKKYVIPNLRNYELGIVCYPFQDLLGIIDNYVKPRIAKDKHTIIEDDFSFKDAQRVILKDLDDLLFPFIKKCKNKIMIGHYRLEGSKYSIYRSSSSFTYEIMFSEDMVKPNDFNIVAFGHIHIPQNMWGYDHVLHVGAINHNNWGEIGNDRSYISYDLEDQSFERISLEYDDDYPERAWCRPLYDYNIKIPLGIDDPNQYIVDKIKKHDYFEDAMVRVKVIIGYNEYKKISDRSIEYSIRDFVYHADIEYDRVSTDPEREIDRSKSHIVIDPLIMLDSFLKKFVDDPNYKEIDALSKKYLKESIREEEVK